MWKYEKKLEYPVNIRKKDIKMAKNLLSQYGGPNSEMSACLMVSQLLRDATIDELKKNGLADYYTEHDNAVFPMSASGVPFTTSYISTTGDYIADLESDMASEQRARATYEHLLDLTDDIDIIGPLEFLRQREIIHYQRFKELRNYYLENKK